MTDLRLGWGLRAIRLRRNSRQLDVAVHAGVSQPVVSRQERGHLDALTIRTIRRIAAALEADVVITLR